MADCRLGPRRPEYIQNPIKVLSVISIAMGFSAGSATAEEAIQQFSGISDSFGACSVYYEYDIPTNSAYISVSVTSPYEMILYFGVDRNGVFDSEANDSASVGALLRDKCSNQGGTFENVEYVAPAGTLENPTPFGVRFTYNGTPYAFSIGDPFKPEATPASEFLATTNEIVQAVMDDAQRSLNAPLGANRRMNEEALDRFIDARRDLRGDGAGFVSRNDVPLDVDGVLRVDGTTLSTRGDVFAQQGSMDGSSRRLFFGGFDIQRDGDTGSTTATLTGRVAWERMLSDSTMLGYFVGGELAFSDIEGAFTGDQERIGATVGLYAVHALDEQVYLDGFLTFGAGRNNLEMANDVLELESDYTTRTATIGAALSGVYEYGSYEFRPELAFSYGYTWIGNVGFTGRAYGLVDDTLSLDAGDVSIANLTLRPEVIWALDGLNVAESASLFTFAPRLICERVEAGTVRQDCGGGAEFGLSSMSSDGLTEFNVRLLADRVGSSTRTGLELGIEHQF